MFMQQMGGYSQDAPLSVFHRTPDAAILCLLTRAILKKQPGPREGGREAGDSLYYASSFLLFNQRLFFYLDKIIPDKSNMFGSHFRER